MPKPAVQYVSISKHFGGVTALSEVSLTINAGECHALMGENGAGKSTLGKILAGIHRPDGGQLIVNGAEQQFRAPADALLAGVGMVHQELAFCPDLTVAENLLMGQYPRRFGVMLDRRAMGERATAILSRIGSNIDVWRTMRELSTAQEQLVQIAAAVATGAGIIVFDEPTSSLSEPEAQQLFKLIEDLKARGVTIIYVSHRMPEVFRLCDRLSVLRDGRYVGTLDRAEATEDKIVAMMIGRTLETVPYVRPPKSAEELLSTRDLSSPGKFSNVSFDLHRGEIVGFAGLVGAGRSEIAQAIIGLDPKARGEVRLLGKPLRLGDQQAALAAGIGLVPEDRKRQGLVLPQGGRFNVAIANADRLSIAGLLIDRKEESKVTHDLYGQMRVKAPSVESPVSAMSGGNQQKVVLAKWLARQCKVLIVDEPTRGVDVGAKAAIHDLLRSLAAQGVAILLISSELPEVLSLAHRVMILRGGRIVAELPHEQADQESVLRQMAGTSQPAAASI